VDGVITPPFPSAMQAQCIFHDAFSCRRWDRQYHGLSLRGHPQRLEQPAQQVAARQRDREKTPPISTLSAADTTKPNIGNSTSCVTNASAKPTTTFAADSIRDITLGLRSSALDFVPVVSISHGKRLCSWTCDEP